MKQNIVERLLHLFLLQISINNSKIDKKEVQVKQRCTVLSSSSSTFKHVRKCESEILLNNNMNLYK
ncbi:hypothetical protein T12_15463 [Trichinella patagoniensis]|uniref:Uncharacterized protein n=1 Tax=Trichinella patagoniensis TaxID=990121 RepID=A0A0V1AF63_9BILA|nr:hypothetical protein T12_15463 [Trichinella patagoniensis]